MVASRMFIGVLGACWHGYRGDLQERGRLLLRSAEYDGRVPGEGRERESFFVEFYVT